MDIKIKDVQITRTDLFANDIIKVGDILGLDKNNVLYRVHNTEYRIPVGIAIYNMVNLDLTRQIVGYHGYEVQIGSKFYFLTSGIVVIHLNKSLKLPTNQPIYCNIQKSCLDFRKLGPTVGKLLANQDEDGYCKVGVDFTR